jgi:prepilin-type N-terminal cleavage/methylation domain-containing protein
MKVLPKETVMKTPHNAHRSGKRAVHGFTILEMAVVLVIIGVILGAVMIGRDAQRNAEYLRIRQTFVNQWAVAYNSYVQRMGVPVGDDPKAPRLIVNGALITIAQIQGALGNMSGIAAPNALCGGTATGPGMRAATLNLRSLMLDAGVQLPQGRGQGMEDRYAYLDTDGNPQELQICFQWNPPGTKSGTGNVMVITGLTPDLARSLASAIKGSADANSGSFRQVGVANGAAGAGSKGVAGGSGTDWTVNNKDTTTGKDKVLLEDQLATVSAHYKMNQ